MRTNRFVGGNLAQFRRVNRIYYNQSFCSSSSSFSTHFDNDNNSDRNINIKQKILQNAIEKQYQITYGWNNLAILQSCHDLNISPVVHTTLTRGPVEMVEFYLSMKHQHVMNKLKEFQLQHTTLDNMKPMENNNKSFELTNPSTIKTITMTNKNL